MVFARLLQGLGQVPFYVDIRFASTQQLVHVSSTHMLVFPDRDTVVEMALTLKGVRFPQAGIYCSVMGSGSLTQGFSCSDQETQGKYHECSATAAFESATSTRNGLDGQLAIVRRPGGGPSS